MVTGKLHWVTRMLRYCRPQSCNIPIPGHCGVRTINLIVTGEKKLPAGWRGGLAAWRQILGVFP